MANRIAIGTGRSALHGDDLTTGVIPQRLRAINPIAVFSHSQDAAHPRFLWQPVVRLGTDTMDQDQLGEMTNNREENAQEFGRIQPAVLAAKEAGDWQGVAALLVCIQERADQDWPLAGFMHLASALQNLGRLAEADDFYAVLCARWPDRLTGWWGRMSVARAREDWPAAAQGWRECLTRFPEQEVAGWRLGLAGVLRRQGDVASARTVAAELRDRWPDDPTGWRLCAELAQHAGDLEAAAAAWQACLDRFPEQQQPAWWAGLVSALQRLDRLEEAETLCTTLQTRWPDDPAWLILAADLASARSDWSVAADLWQSYFARFTASIKPEQYFNYAKVLVKARRRTELAEVIGKAGKLWPKESALDPNLRDTPEAQNALRVWIWQAQSYLRFGDPAKSFEMLADFPGDLNQTETAAEIRNTAAELMRVNKDHAPAMAMKLTQQEYERRSSALVWRCPEGSDRAIFLFAGGGDAFWITMQTLHSYLQHLGCNLVFIMDESQSMYLPPSIPKGPSLGDELREIADSLDAKQIYCVGTSIGGYGALRLGLELGAKAVLGFGACTNPGRLRSQQFQKQLVERVRREQPNLVLDAAELYRNAKVRPLVTLVYGGAHTADTADAEGMRDVPGVTLRPIPGYGDHSVVRWLIGNRQLIPLFQEMLGDIPTRTEGVLQ